MLQIKHYFEILLYDIVEIKCIEPNPRYNDKVEFITYIGHANVSLL